MVKKEVVCKRCKRSDGLYEVMAIEGTAWWAMEVLNTSQGFKPKPVGHLEEPQYEPAYTEAYGCGNCGEETETLALDDLVEVPFTGKLGIMGVNKC